MKGVNERWEKSSRCTARECVEVLRDYGVVYMRASGNPAQYAAFTDNEWRAFLEGVKQGEFDV